MDPGLLFGFYDEYTFHSDIYSLGMVILSIVYSDYFKPWHNIESLNELKNVVIDENRQEEIPDNCPEIIKKIILMCWEAFAKLHLEPNLRF
jgi:hypothetical protein